MVTIPDDQIPTSTWCKEENFYVYRLRIPKILRKERYFPIFLVRKMNYILEDVNPDIIHFAHGFFAPLITRINRNVAEKPIVWTIQNVPPYEHKLDLFKRLRLLNIILEKIYFFVVGLYGRLALKLFDYDHLVCVSEKTAELAMGKGAMSNKVRVIHDGVDTDFFTSKEGVSKIKEELGFQKYSPIILTVAGIIPHKGLECLVRAVPGVLEKYPDVLFLIIGPVRSEAHHRRLESLMAELGLSGNIRIIAGADQLELGEYYAACDIYVQPSLEEGFCMSILEAMSCGKPVIGTRTGAIPRFIEESGGGILIEPAELKQMFEAVVGLLSDPEKAKEMGERSRGYVVDNYSWKSIVKDTLRLYKSLG